ncbi:MAG: class I SAM-dependent RNA methyltransferase, partial [Cyanobium sp.]
MDASTPFMALAVVPPGLEAIAGEELAQLGAHTVKPQRGAVSFSTDPVGLYRRHLRARLPFRLLRELARFPCTSRRD